MAYRMRLSATMDQFSSQEFEQFTRSHDILHTTSSPYYPQGNGLAERAVKTVKSLLKKADDPYQALLAYRTTPFPWCGLSPAQLLMGRQPRNGLPQTESQLTPDWCFLASFRQSDTDFKKKQEESYNRRHRVRSQESPTEGTRVSLRSHTHRSQGSIVSKASTPRSYWVDTPSGEVRRNRRHLAVLPDSAVTNHSSSATPISRSRSPIATRSRTNTDIRPPERLCC